MASPEEGAVAQTVDACYKAVASKNQQQLEALLSDQLSYGHSVGRIETKAEFIAASVSPRTTWKSLGPVDQSISVSGDTATVRHIMTGENLREGQPGSVKMGVMMMMQKQGGVWKMLARQGYKV
jgi:hypothetical protein